MWILQKWVSLPNQILNILWLVCQPNYTIYIILWSVHQPRNMWILWNHVSSMQQNIDYYVAGVLARIYGILNTTGHPSLTIYIVYCDLCISWGICGPYISNILWLVHQPSYTTIQTKWWYVKGVAKIAKCMWTLDWSASPLRLWKCDLGVSDGLLMWYKGALY